MNTRMKGSTFVLVALIDKDLTQLVGIANVQFVKDQSVQVLLVVDVVAGSRQADNGSHSIQGSDGGVGQIVHHHYIVALFQQTHQSMRPNVSTTTRHQDSRTVLDALRGHGRYRNRSSLLLFFFRSSSIYLGVVESNLDGVTQRFVVVFDNKEGAETSSFDLKTFRATPIRPNPRMDGHAPSHAARANPRLNSTDDGIEGVFGTADGEQVGDLR